MIGQRRSIRIVEADNLLIRVVALADDAEAFHIEAGGCQFLDGRFGRRMVSEDGDDRVDIFHRNSP